MIAIDVYGCIQSDARALRTVLSLTGVKEGLKGHIVVELSDLDNEVLVKLVGGDLVKTVVAHDVIGRLMIQCARQPGLAQVNSALLKLLSCSVNIIVSVIAWLIYFTMIFYRCLLCCCKLFPACLCM